jgi:hypothetical protein
MCHHFFPLIQEWLGEAKRHEEIAIGGWVHGSIDMGTGGLMIPSVWPA